MVLSKTPNASSYRRIREDQALLTSLRNHVPELVELYNPYKGPAAALTRFANLPKTTFQRIDTYREGDFTFPVLDPINSEEDRKTAEPLIARWEGLLNEHKIHKEQAASAIRIDAEVLATIEYVSSLLRVRDEGKKLALVTGSRYLFDAAETYKPGTEMERRTFAELYLRHPQAFLAHSDFFLLSDKREFQFKLVDWLNLFFPSGLLPAVQPQGVVSRDILREIRRGGNRNIYQVIQLLTRWDKSAQPFQRLIEGWQNQVDAVAKDRYADGLNKAGERGLKQLATKLLELYKDNHWSLADLRELVSAESLGSVSKLYSTTVWVGSWSKAARQESKGVPALRFDDRFEEIEPYCEEVIRLQLKKRVTPEDLGKLLKLNRDLEDADPSLYHAHIIHALAFAVKGHYHATLTLARTAIAICDSIDPRKRGFLQGREAAYLASIAARRSVKDRSDLDIAKMYLEQAVNRDSLRATKDIRFTSEHLAIETRRVFFDLFCERNDLDSRVVIALLEELNQLVKQAANEGNPRARHWILRQSLTNYFTLVLIHRETDPKQTPRDDDEIKNNLKILGEVLADYDYGRTRADDPFAHLILDICIANWGLAQEPRERARTAAREALTHWGPHHVPYDRGRLEFLRRCIPAKL